MPSSRAAIASVMCAAAALSGCGTSAPQTTYAREVRPLLRDRCVVCHQAGAVAPFPLDDFASAASHAREIVAATQARRMPPVPATADGTCQTFADAKWLTDGELETLRSWLEAGAPEGAGATDVAPPSEALNGNLTTLKLPAPYTPRATADGPDRYRCFAIKLELPSSGYVSAAQFLAGDPSQVHHIAMYAVDPKLSLGAFDNAQGIAAMEADDPEPGWDCYTPIGSAAEPRSQLPSWFGGDPIVAMPTGYGMLLRAGEWVVVQIHYRAKSTPTPDRTTIRLKLEPVVDVPVIAIFRDPITFASGVPPELPPGQADAAFDWELPASEFESELRRQGLDGLPGFRWVGSAAHMHELGVQYRLGINAPEQQPQCALEIRAWDFHWQRSYIYAQPLEVEDPAAKIHVRCSYDTRSVTRPVFAGHDKGREMCSLIAYIAPRR